MRNLKYLYLAFIAVALCAAPSTVIISRGVQSKADVSWAPVLIAVPVAIAGFIVCLALRTAASRRYVAAAIQRGKASASPAFIYTLIAWVLASGAGGLTLATWLLYESANEPSAYRAALAEYPMALLFVFAGLAVLGTAAYHTLIFRRQNEYPLLEEYGVARLVVPPQNLPKKEALKQRTRMWLQGTAVDGAFFLGALLPRLAGDDQPTADEWGDGSFLVVAGPGVVSFSLLLLMLVYWPTRRSAFEAFRRPSSLAALGLVGVGVLLDTAGRGPAGSSGIVVAGAVVGISGVVIASATCMNIMDRGSQPMIGLVYLAGNYIYGYLTSPDRDIVLPAGTVPWIVAILAAIYTFTEGRSHWRRWNTLEPLTSGDERNTG